jgi:formylmethanofuran dehydrogenase subunit A
MVRDIWIRGGKIVTPPQSNSREPVRGIDCTGRVVMPGGVDIHCHIAGPKVNAARKMLPEMARRENAGQRDFRGMRACHPVPAIHETGLRYTALGYTACFDAAVTPLAARHVHHEFSQLPNLDRGFFVLVGNNHYAMRRIAAGDREGLKTFLAWLLARCGSLAPKLVNPGGVEMWKQRARGNAHDLDQQIDGFNITPRQIISSIAEAANDLRLPHPIHIHTNNLGIPGNWTTTLETLRAIQGLRGHLAHIQFHSYGGGGADEASFGTKVGPLADFVNANPNMTVDVGQVMFGPTATLTGDSPLGYYLRQFGDGRWFSKDTELESGCGISPITYRNKNWIHTLQWAIGLEWYLLVKNAWQIALSSDHPNGASFQCYPRIIRLLMDAGFRREQLATVNRRALRACSLPDLDREYSLAEIAIITRAGPARMLGLRDKGHIGPGADADVTVYTPDANYEQMFAWPTMVIKAGEVVIEDGEFRETTVGKTLYSHAAFDRERGESIESWFDANYSVSNAHFGINHEQQQQLMSIN